MGVIIYNGKSSDDFYIEVEHPPRYSGPERDFDSYHVPGRNGDIYVDKGTFKNVDCSYDISFGSYSKNFDEMLMRVVEWLYSATAYARLEDSYSPEYYRLAKYVGPTEFENILNHGGKGTITFNCQPQKYLKSGEKPITFTETGILRNPTIFVAAPILTVKGMGSGVLNIDRCSIGITDISSSITIDCGDQDAYSGNVNRNDSLELNEERAFPKLKPGNNLITFSGGITAVEVIPKWWII